jgi:cytochrome c oxidase subunit IV
MTTQVDTADAGEVHPEDQIAHREHAHPSEKQYFVVAGILAVLTAIEVGLYYIEDLSDNALVAMLGVLAITKFVMVVLYFMHLKFDSAVFRRLFWTGLGLALAVYCAVLAAMHFFSGGTNFVTVG